MDLQKKLLESQGWKCSKCACNNGRGWDCASDDFKGYIITLRPSGIARIVSKGHIVASIALHKLKDKMEELGLMIKTTT